MQIDKGKTYRTRNGERKGPIEKVDSYGVAWIGKEAWWAYNGSNHLGQENPGDLIAEWADAPARLKAGTYYDGYGDKVEIRNHTNPRWPFTDGKRYFDEKGRFSGDNRKLDLIAEWTEGPVRTVTRREVVPGVYDHVSVELTHGRSDAVSVCLPVVTLTSAELKAAAAVLLELAGALPDGE